MPWRLALLLCLVTATLLAEGDDLYENTFSAIPKNLVPLQDAGTVEEARQIPLPDMTEKGWDRFLRNSLPFNLSLPLMSVALERASATEVGLFWAKARTMPLVPEIRQRVASAYLIATGQRILRTFHASATEIQDFSESHAKHAKELHAQSEKSLVMGSIASVPLLVVVLGGIRDLGSHYNERVQFLSSNLLGVDLTFEHFAGAILIPGTLYPVYKFIQRTFKQVDEQITTEYQKDLRTAWAEASSEALDQNVLDPTLQERVKDHMRLQPQANPCPKVLSAVLPDRISTAIASMVGTAGLLALGNHFKAPSEVSDWLKTRVETAKDGMSAIRTLDADLAKHANPKSALGAAAHLVVERILASGDWRERVRELHHSIALHDKKLIAAGKTNLQPLPVSSLTSPEGLAADLHDGKVSPRLLAERLTETLLSEYQAGVAVGEKSSTPQALMRNFGIRTERPAQANSGKK